MQQTEEIWTELKPDGSNLRVTDFLSLKLTAVSVLLHRNLTRQYLEMHRVSLSEWRMLTLLIDKTPISAVDVNKQSGMDKGQISRALMLLQQKKLVERTADDKDARRQILDVTAKGRQLFERVMRDARRKQFRILNELTVSDRKNLLRILAKITEAAARLSEDTAPSGPAKAGARKRARTGTARL